MNKEPYEKLSPEVQEQLNNPLHETLCESIITLLKDSLENSDLLKEEIQSAREFAQLKPDTKVSKELLEFLDSDRVKDSLIK